MATFVLVHGAAHGGWCWDRVVAALQAHGHRALAPDLPGAGDDPAEPGDVDLDDYAARVRATVEASGARVVLVGHSMGGVTLTRVAEEIPERLFCCVFLSAFMLRSGEHARSITLLEEDPEILRAIEFAADGLVYRYLPGPAGELFYADCQPQDAQAALARLRPMPRVIAQTPVRWTRTRAGAVPRVYIECLRDRAIPLELQRAMQKLLPPAEVLQLDSGHSPFLAVPERLAELLHGVAAAYTA